MQVMDGYFMQGAHHRTSTCLAPKLIDAVEHPEKEKICQLHHPRINYAVRFIDLTREQRLDVIARTCHDRM